MAEHPSLNLLVVPCACCKPQGLEVHFVCHAIACDGLLITITSVSEARVVRPNSSANSLADAATTEVRNAFHLLVVKEEVESPYVTILTCKKYDYSLLLHMVERKCLLQQASIGTSTSGV